MPLDSIGDLQRPQAKESTKPLLGRKFVKRLQRILGVARVELSDAQDILVLATGPGNPAAVRIRTGKTVRFGSRPVQKPDPELFGGPNPYPYSSIRGFCRVWQDPSVPVSGSPIRVCLFMVAVIYISVMWKILTLVHHSLYWFHLQPLYSKQGETCSLLHPEVECDQVCILHHL